VSLAARDKRQFKVFSAASSDIQVKRWLKNLVLSLVQQARDGERERERERKQWKYAGVAGKLPLYTLEMTQSRNNFISCKPDFVLRKQVFWIVAPGVWVIASRWCEETCRILLQGCQSVNWLSDSHLKMKWHLSSILWRHITQLDGSVTEKTCFLCFVDLRPGMILVNKQLDAQFFMYVYFYSLHVSGSHVPIIRRISGSMWHLVYVTLCRWPSGMQVRAAMCPSSGELLDQCDTWFMSLCVDDRLACRLTCIPDSHLHRVT